MNKALFVFTKPLWLASLFCLVLGGASVFAEDDSKAVELEKIKTKIVQLTQEINFLNEKAIASIPELGEQKSKYDALIKNTIKALGHDADALESRLKEISARATNTANNLSAEERKALQEEFIEKRNTLTQSFIEATKRPEVKAAAEKLAKSLSKGIRSLNPDSGKLETELKSLQEKYQQLSK